MYHGPKYHFLYPNIQTFLIPVSVYSGIQCNIYVTSFNITCSLTLTSFTEKNLEKDPKWS